MITEWSTYGDKNSYSWTMWIYCVAKPSPLLARLKSDVGGLGWMNSVSGSHMLKVGFVFLNGSSFIQCSHGRYSGTSINSLHWGWSWSIVVMDCCDLQKVLESTTKRLFEIILLMVYGLDGWVEKRKRMMIRFKIITYVSCNINCTPLTIDRSIISVTPSTSATREDEMLESDHWHQGESQLSKLVICEEKLQINWQCYAD